MMNIKLSIKTKKEWLQNIINTKVGSLQMAKIKRKFSRQKRHTQDASRNIDLDTTGIHR